MVRQVPRFVTPFVFLREVSGANAQLVETLEYVYYEAYYGSLTVQ